MNAQCTHHHKQPSRPVDDAGNFDYISGVEVSDFSDLPREFASVRIPEQRYAVFTHREHISSIDTTSRSIEEIATTILHRGGLQRHIF